jgi:hypothetical protein
VVTGRNNIVWGNTAGGINLNPAPALTYSDVQGASVLPGLGNINADPLFVDPAGGDYHEKSPGGSWHGGAWTRDSSYSPCIDAGTPGDAFSLEPGPRGTRINMGAYGNTAQASKTGRGTVISTY